MTGTRGLKEKARLIPRGNVIEKRMGIVATRPLRLAFVINTDTLDKTLIKYLAYNASIWGGIYNCLIPTDGRCLRDDWWSVLRRHDPDKVILCGEKTPELRRQIQDELQPFSVRDWTDRVVEDPNIVIDRFGSIPLRAVLATAYEKWRPITQSGIRLPALPSECAFRLCVAAQLGALDDELSTFCVDALGAEYVDFAGIDLESYLTSLQDFSDRTSPLDMTRWDLSTSYELDIGGWGFNLVLLDNANVADICLFWNLRMASPWESKETLLVSIEMLRRPRNLEALAAWCNRNILGTTFLTLSSATVGRARLVRLRDRIKKLLDKRFQVVDVWHKGFTISRFVAYDNQSREEIVLENGAFNLKNPLPSVGEHVQTGMQWVVDVDFRGFPRFGQGYIPPRYPDLNHLLSGRRRRPASRLPRDYYSLRVAQKRLAFRVGRSQAYIGARLPEDKRLFASLLHDKGYESHTTDKCRYTTGIIRLLEGYKRAEILRDAGLRRLLYAMQDGQGRTPSEMKADLKIGGDASQHERVARLVADLALKGIFVRGHNIRCPACDLGRWYPMDDVSEKMECAGCLARLQPPIDAPFRYRLNELMVRGVEQGAIPVLLTILALSALGDDSFLFVPGIEVARDGDKVDIDLVSACNGYLVLAECKDLHEGCTPKTAQKITEQLSGTVRVAVEIGARIVVLSSLRDELPQELEQGIISLREEHKDVAIKVMLRADLEQGSQDKEAVEDFLPKREAADSGWVREDGPRKMYF